jgi:hypothetical protein
MINDSLAIKNKRNLTNLFLISTIDFIYTNKFIKKSISAKIKYSPLFYLMSESS